MLHIHDQPFEEHHTELVVALTRGIEDDVFGAKRKRMFNLSERGTFAAHTSGNGTGEDGPCRVGLQL